MTDRELLKLAREGSERAFEKLIKRYESQVAATVIGMLGHGDISEDVGQEVFIRFYKALHQFREDSKLGTYLTRIAINLSLNEIKKRKRRQLFFKSGDDDLNGAFIDPEDSVSRNERKGVVQKAIQKLAPEFRTVIVLRLIDGYSTTETAEILQIPSGTVLSRLSRAQKKLKKLLTPLILEEA
ncbi:sigma-70 family RNA polymerase sigma factor [bacterium]|nr:sigma-70 family RNA polymerase sigma factor [bacterium]